MCQSSNAPLARDLLCTGSAPTSCRHLQTWFPLFEPGHSWLFHFSLARMLAVFTGAIQTPRENKIRTSTDDAKTMTSITYKAVLATRCSACRSCVATQSRCHPHVMRGKNKGCYVLGCPPLLLSSLNIYALRSSLSPSSLQHSVRPAVDW